MQKNFDRHPYLKHSTAMPAHKDTKHPAGQVVNQDKGQSTLSDYIRSINRAQAFDDVAQEKKLTFDEWYVSMFGSGNWYSPDVVGVFKIIWNDALTRGKV